MAKASSLCCTFHARSAGVYVPVHRALKVSVRGQHVRLGRLGPHLGRLRRRRHLGAGARAPGWQRRKHKKRKRRPVSRIRRPNRSTFSLPGKTFPVKHFRRGVTFGEHGNIKKFTF